MRILLISGHKPKDNYVTTTGTYEGQLNTGVVEGMYAVLRRYCEVVYYPLDRDYYKDLKNKDLLSQYDMSHYNYVFEVHFNSFGDGSARGSSVQIHKSYTKGISVERAVAKALGNYFKLRGEGGIVRRNDLLNMNTAFAKEVDYALVEVCFHDNAADLSVYRNNKEAIIINMAMAIVDAFGLRNKQNFTVTKCDFLNLRKTPNGGIIGRMQAGTEVEKIGEDPDSDGDNWYKVKTEKGTVGYVWPKYLM